MENTLVILVLVEEVRLVYIEVIVVTECVTLLYLAVGVVYVVLYVVAVRTEVADRELVDVGVFLGTHKVTHGLVVHTLGSSKVDSYGTCVVAVVLDVQYRAEVQCELVVVAAFYVVETLAAYGIGLLVGKVHVVPVELAVGLACLPVVVACHVVGKLVIGRGIVDIPYVICCTRQVLIVVGTWVGCVAVPAEGCCAVH